MKQRTDFIYIMYIFPLSWLFVSNRNGIFKHFWKFSNLHTHNPQALLLQL